MGLSARQSLCFFGMAATFFHRGPHLQRISALWSLCCCGFSVREFAAAGFLSESLPLRVFSQRICRCGISLREFATVCFLSENLLLWAFSQRICCCGLSLGQFTTVSSSPKNLPWSISPESGHTRDSVGWMVCQCRRHLHEFTTVGVLLEDRLPVGEGSHCSGVPLSVGRRMAPMEENADCHGEGLSQVSQFCC